MVKDDYALVGVADGTEEYGHQFFEEVLRTIAENKLSARFGDMKKAPGELLKELVMKAIESMKVKLKDLVNEGLTTLTIALVLADRQYALVAIGDSDPYRIKPDGRVSRVLRTKEKGIVRERGVDRSEQPWVGVHTLDIATYLRQRHIIQYALLRSPGNVQPVEGQLGEGELLYLATDGHKDNLRLRTRADGKVIHGGTCDDFSDILMLEASNLPLDLAGEHIVREIERRVSLKGIRVNIRCENPRMDLVHILERTDTDLLFDHIPLLESLIGKVRILDVLAPVDDDIGVAMIGINPVPNATDS